MCHHGLQNLYPALYQPNKHYLLSILPPNLKIRVYYIIYSDKTRINRIMLLQISAAERELSAYPFETEAWAQRRKV